MSEAAVRLAARHRREPMRYIEADHCPACRVPWPCDTAVVLQERADERMAVMVALVRIGFLVTVGDRRAVADDVQGPARETLMTILEAVDSDAAVLAILSDTYEGAATS